MKDTFIKKRLAVAMVGASLAALPGLVLGAENGKGTNQVANLYVTNAITFGGETRTNWPIQGGLTISSAQVLQWDNAVVIKTAGSEPLTSGNLCYFSAAGTWSNANASAPAMSQGLLGLALGTNAAVDGLLLCGRYTNAAWSFTVGDVIFVNTNAGSITATRPVVADQVVRIVGYAIGTNEVMFNPDRTYIELQ